MRRCVSICLIGGDESGVPTNNFTANQRRALRELVAMLGREFPETKGNLVSRTPAVSSDETASWVL
jgi:hypothetical protein